MGRNGGVGRAPPPPPPDEKRCTRTDGKRWRCKNLKFQGLSRCEKHSKLSTTGNVKDKLKEQIHSDEKDKGLLRNGKKRNGVDSSEEEEEEEEESGDDDDDDEQRCTRNNGKGWQCKSLKFRDTKYCEKHHNDDILKRNRRHALKKQVHRDRKDKGIVRNGKKRNGVDSVMDSSETEDDEEEVEEEEVIRPEKKKRRGDSNVEDKGFQKRQMRRRLGAGFSSSSEEEVEEDVQVQPTIIKNNYTEVFDMKRSEECSNSELILSLKTCFRDIDVEKVVSILKLREEKVKMEKEVAEKKAACFKKELETCEINCKKMLDEVEEKKMKEVNAVKDKLGDLELKRVAIEEELHRYKRMCTELKTKIVDLETEKRVAEKERITAENEKRRAENETGLWKERFQALNTKAFPTDVYVEPQGFSTDISYTKERKMNVTRQMGIEGGIDCALDRGCLSKIKSKELELKAEVYASTNVDSISHPSAKERGMGQHAGPGVKNVSVAREKMACQPEGNSYKMLTSPRMEHRTITREKMASQPDGGSYICSPTVYILRPASESIAEISNGTQETKINPIHSKEGSDQKQNGGEKGTDGRACDDFQFKITKCQVSSVEGLSSGRNYHMGSSDSQSCVIPTVLTQLENSPAETHKEKKVKDFGLDHGAAFNGSSANSKPDYVEDGVSKFLRELQRLKANKPNWKRSPLVAE